MAEELLNLVLVGLLAGLEAVLLIRAEAGVVRSGVDIIAFDALPTDLAVLLPGGFACLPGDRGELPATLELVPCFEGLLKDIFADLFGPVGELPRDLADVTGLPHLGGGEDIPEHDLPDSLPGLPGCAADLLDTGLSNGAEAPLREASTI